MEKKFNSIQIATLRNVARLIYPIQEKIDALNKKIESIAEEAHKLREQANVWDKPIVDMFGYHTINLIKKEKVDKRTVYALRYPETIVPVETSEPVTEEAEPEEVEQIPEGNVPEDISEAEEQEVEEQEVEELENPFENPQEEEAQEDSEENSEEEVFY